MFKDPWASQSLALNGIETAIENLADSQKFYNDRRYDKSIQSLRFVRLTVKTDLNESMKRITNV